MDTMDMANQASSRDYHRLQVEADAPDTEIWLGDQAGFLVEKAIGRLDSRLMPGEYVVEFGRGGPCYPVSLDAPLSLSEREISAGPSCPRPRIRSV